MAGNVRELCNDFSTNRGYSAGPATNPTGPSKPNYWEDGNGIERFSFQGRGGCIAYGDWGIGASANYQRHSIGSVQKIQYVGFRVARKP